MRREVVCFCVFLWSSLLFSEETELRFYRPLTDTTNQLPLNISETIAGECTQQSPLIKREDAWRCVAEGKEYDPCFVMRFGTHLDAVCPESPWSSNAIKITVKKPLDNSQHDMLDMSQTYPWAMELGNGEKCQAVVSSETYDNLPVRYHCDRNTVLIGHVQRCTSEWKILQRGADGVVTAVIARAWF